MGWFSNLRMRNKLLFAIGIVLLLSGALGGAALRSLSQIGQAYDDVTDNSMPSIQALADMEITLRDGRILWLSSFIAKDDREVEENARNAVALRKTLEERARKYEGLVADDGERRLYEDFRKSLDVYLGGQAQIADYIRNKQMNEARDLINGLQKQRLADTSDRLTALTDYNKASADKAVDRANGVEVTARTTVIGGVGLALLVGFGFAFMIAARMAAPLAKMSQTMERAAEGDLTARAEVDSTDEIGHMAATLNAFLKRLHDSIAEVAQTSRHVASASDELSSGAQQLASGSQEQASSLEETAASIEQMNGTIAQNATSAEQARDLATGSSESADRGASVVGDAVQAMERISEASKKIGEIIGVIDEIAFQTNLLALNAAVEAARAGDQGRGFAVVASEVRTLAQRSATAAKEIKTLIQDSLSCVEDGSRLVHASGETLHEIVASVKRVTDLTVQIATAGREQASGIEQINGAVGQMDRVVQSNSAQTEELSATAGELASQAESLRRLVERFKIDSSYSGGALAERAPSDRGLASLPPAKQRTRPGRLQSPSPARPTPRAPAARPSPKPSQRPTTDQLADF